MEVAGNVWPGQERTVEVKGSWRVISLQLWTSFFLLLKVLDDTGKKVDDELIIIIIIVIIHR